MESKIIVMLLSLSGFSAGADDVFTQTMVYNLDTVGHPVFFNVRNNLKGDVEFRESTNFTLEVFLSGKREDKERFQVQNRLVSNSTIMDIQVWLNQEQFKWVLIGYICSAVLVLSLTVITPLCIKRYRSSTMVTSDDGDVDICTDHIVQDRVKAFDNIARECTENKPMNYSRRFNVGKSKSTTPILVMSLFTVVMAITSTTIPQAHVVIQIPSKIVRIGSKIYFNKEHHGRLILSRDWQGDVDGVFQQFAVTQAFSAKPIVCPSHCKYCDSHTNECICLRGYQLINNTCQDIDECLTGGNNCYMSTLCRNINGSFQCTCPYGLWGDGIHCQACTSVPCPEGFYQSEPCTTSRDRKCTACGPKCSKSNYQKYGCGQKFDRKCIDISKPLVEAKKINNTDILKTRAGSKLYVLNTAQAFQENRLDVQSINHSFIVNDSKSLTFSLERNTGFIVDVEVSNTHLTPRYVDYDGERGSNNHAISSIPGFYYATGSLCRFPAPKYYVLNHILHKQRQTRIKRRECTGQADSYTCPNDMAKGETYFYRDVSEACRLAASNLVCQPDFTNCRLKESNDKVYCTRYTSILRDLFSIDQQDFQDTTLYEFDSQLCKNAFLSCHECRNRNCSQCMSDSDSCSCCIKDCLTACEVYYSLQCTSKMKLNRCGLGDVSEFQLSPQYDDDMGLGYNCYLKYQPPSSLYSVRYRVRYNNSFTSPWRTKTQSQRHKQAFDFLDIAHMSKVTKQYYMKAVRRNSKNEFKYSVADMDGARQFLSTAHGAQKIQPLQPFLFHIGDNSWKNTKTCFRLEAWKSMITGDFSEFQSPQVRKIGASRNGGFEYEIFDSLPRMHVGISKDESILRYAYNGSSIINDQSFKSRMERQNSSWIIHLQGKLKSCPSAIGLSVTDELDHASLIKSDILVLCPNKKFVVKIEIPRQGSQELEKLFTVFLSDSSQMYKLQLAVVDTTIRSSKDKLRENKDDIKKEPWVVLSPLFATTGFVFIALVTILIYAHRTAKHPSKMELASASGWVWVDDSNKDEDLYTSNRLKRRHLILVVFVVIARVLYSFVFNFSMAFAVLKLLHADNLEIIDDYRSFVQSKINDSTAISLRMDQYREQEIKASVDQADNVQKACDYHLGLELQRLHNNMTCTLQANNLKIFNKISEKIARKIAAESDALKQTLKHSINRFSKQTRRRLSDLKDDVGSYGRRVYDSEWFALPRGAYHIARGRKKREITSKNQHHLKPDVDILSRDKRSFTGNSFIGFLDFVGVLDQDKLSQLEQTIHHKIESTREDFNDLKDIMIGRSKEVPVSTGLLCPVRHINKMVKQALDKGLPNGIRGLCDKKSKDKHHTNCLNINITKHCSSDDDDDEVDDINLYSSSQRIHFEKPASVYSEQNVSSANKSSVLNSAQGESHYNIEKGDSFEEQVDTQKEESLTKQGKLKQLGSIYDAMVFRTIRSVVFYIMTTIDILLLIYRALRTYQIVMKLLYGFEETITHDPFEHREPNIKETAANIIRTTIDVIIKCFIKFMQVLRRSQKKVLSSNIVPTLVAIALGSASFYLIIIIVFNVMSVRVLEEIGGYKLISARLDVDLHITNAAITDHIKYLNDHEMQSYKTFAQSKLHHYNKVLQDFAASEKQRFEDFNFRLCSLSGPSECVPLKPDFPVVSFTSCIIPRISAKKFQEYDGTEYRSKLKYESKKYIDAVRNIFLNTLYFIITLILASGLIAISTVIMFSFMKSKDMIRVRYVHVYSNLPKELLQQYEMDGSSDENEEYTDNARTTEATFTSGRIFSKTNTPIPISKNGVGENYEC